MNVVLATDGRAPAEAAATLLGRLVRRDRTTVHVVAVSSFDTVLAAAEQIGRYDPAEGRREAERAMHVTVRLLREAGVDADGAVREGDPAGEILSAAKESGAEVVAVGAGHTRRLEQLLLGSTSTRVLHEAPCSVLVVHGVRAGMPHVVVGTDGSTGSAAATRVLAALADPRRVGVRVVAAATATAAGEDVQRAAREAAVRAGDETAGGLRSAGFDVAVDVVEGDPRDVLLGYAEAHDLLVVGSRGMGAVRRAILGSVSDALARQGRATLVAR